MILKYFIQAYEGKLIWTLLKKKYGSGLYPSRYLIFPDKDIEYNFWGLYYLTDFILKNKFDNITILTIDDDIVRVANNYKFINIIGIKVTEKKMDCLIRYAALVSRMDEWTIVSVKKPFDTGAERLLGKKGVGKGDIVWYDIFRMSCILGGFDLKKVNEIDGLDRIWSRLQKVR